MLFVALALSDAAWSQEAPDEAEEDHTGTDANLAPAEEEETVLAPPVSRFAPLPGPPGRSEAKALVDALVEQVGEPDPQWIADHIGSGERPVPLSDRQTAGWLAALGTGGALGEQLKASQGIAAVVDGPDYTRVVLQGTPLLSVRVRSAEAGAFIDRVEITSCALCSEPARFVRDLVEDVQRRGTASDRLLPGIELDMDAWFEEHPGHASNHWLALLQARNHKSGELTWRLRSAQVTAVSADTVTVRYADGAEDPWPIHYVDGHWAVDYAGLTETSPLRLSRQEAEAWRSKARLEQAALNRWAPTFAASDDRTGRQLGDRAIGAFFDAKGRGIWVVVADLDRILSGAFLVDPDRGTVLERVHIPPPSPRTNIRLGEWFIRWHVGVNPDGHTIAVSLPSRLYTVDLDSGAVRSLAGPHDVRQLSWDGDALLVHRSDRIHIYEGGVMTGRLATTGTALTTAKRDDTRWVLTEAGAWHGADVPTTEPGLCCAHTSAAQTSPDGQEVLAWCDVACSQPGLRMDVASGHITQLDNPAEGDAVGWSADGSRYVTPHPDGLAVRSGTDDHIEAVLPLTGVRRVELSEDGDQVLTVGRDGQVWIWSVPELQARYPVP